ncbi:hypothetical protein [Methylovirgula sp. 4M-Z18]|uniref:hypothetical protein n=1 Tax=Methylovirgula sp. 4M-Z18 TaxID=2293567 RepID=UPI000E2E83C2|nr:hypothetical protein [Methylovirgula sp. 4M-Z18]
MTHLVYYVAAAIFMISAIIDLKPHVDWRRRSRREFGIAPGGLIEMARYDLPELNAWLKFVAAVAVWVLSI